MSKIRLAFAGSALLLLGVPATGASVSFEQISFDSYGLDGLPPIHTALSDWGAALIDYTGPSETLYFNLSVNGIWQAVNVPLAALDGVGADTRLTYTFDLGNSIGTKVDSVSYGFSVTTSALLTAPAATGTAAVGDRTVTFAGGLGKAGTPAAEPPPPPPTPQAPEEAGGDPGWITGAHHTHFPNQTCRLNHCVPTGMSNSLQFLDERYGLNIPAEKISKEKMAEALGTRDEEGTDPEDESGVTFTQKKDAYLRREGIPIRTGTSDDIETVFEAIRGGFDVEAVIYPDDEEEPGHFVAIVGIWRYPDGRYGIIFADDPFAVPEGEPRKGDPEYRFDRYDASTKRFERMSDYTLDSFVIESVIPEPASWALLICGFGLVGWRLRRQTAQSA